MAEESPSDETFAFYRPQTKFAKVIFLHLSVCPRELMSRPRPGGQGLVWLGAGGVSRPRPRGEVGGSSWGVSRPRQGVSRPTPGGGGVQAQVQGGLKAQTGGVYPSMH